MSSDSQIENENIYIRASSKRNGLTSITVGIVALVVAFMMFQFLPKQATLFAIFITSLAIVALLIGWFKIREPVHSLHLNRNSLTYHHRKGQWQIHWDNIQRFDIPKITQGVEQTPLSLVGIRLKEYRPLLQSISPRLATHILMEQRPLLLQSQEANCSSGTCYGDDLIEDDKFKDTDGQVYNGVLAMFANRMTKLRDRLGYDLYINSAELDRENTEFVQLLRDCQASVVAHDVVDSAK